MSNLSRRHGGFVVKQRLCAHLIKIMLTTTLASYIFLSSISAIGSPYGRTIGFGLVALTLFGAIFQSGGRADIFRKVGAMLKGRISTSVDMFVGPLSDLADVFEQQLTRSSQVPSFFNLVDLCGATRTCWHRTASAWWLNRMLPPQDIARMKDLTERSLHVLEVATQSRGLKDWQKVQVTGMISNLNHRVKFYDVLLDQKATMLEKRERLVVIAQDLEAAQKEIVDQMARA